MATVNEVHLNISKSNRAILLQLAEEIQEKAEAQVFKFFLLV